MLETRLPLSSPHGAASRDARCVRLVSRIDMTNPDVPLTTCPCGTGLPYAVCCGRWHAGDQHLQAPTAELLMRSRYTAFVRGDAAYLLATWHPRTRPRAPLTLPLGVEWLGLEVRHHQQAGDTATVAFEARSTLGGRVHRLVETSRFVREHGCWYYVDGDIAP